MQISSFFENFYEKIKNSCTKKKFATGTVFLQKAQKMVFGQKWIGKKLKLQGENFGVKLGVKFAVVPASAVTIQKAHKVNGLGQSYNKSTHSAKAESRDLRIT